MTVISKRGTALVVAVAAGATAAVAGAVPPPPDGTFQGNTSQSNIERHRIQVETNADGHVQRVFIQWRAKCKVKGQFWTSTTKVANGPNGLAQSGDQFSRKKTYTGDAGGGVKGRITYTLKGHFEDNDNAAGTWTAKVIVKRKGKKIDTCKLPQITWTAQRVITQG
jgi:hypothetical protein